MSRSRIHTYQAQPFRDKFMEGGKQTHALLGPGFGRFFIAKVEDTLALMRLPVSPVRITTHSFIFLTEGEAIMSIGPEQHSIYRHEGLFVPAGQVFSFEHADVNKGFMCNFGDDILLPGVHLKELDFLQLWGNPRISLEERAANFVLQSFQRLLEEYEAKGLERLGLIQAYLQSLLTEIHFNSKGEGRNISKQALAIFRSFKELLYTHFKEKQRAGDYAEMLNISPNHLNKVLKQHTGKSTLQWIQEVLILEAKALFFQSRLSVSEVVEEIGMSDPSYFSRLFKKHVGMSPSQYLKMIDLS